MSPFFFGSRLVVAGFCLVWHSAGYAREKCVIVEIYKYSNFVDEMQLEVVNSQTPFCTSPHVRAVTENTDGMSV